MIKKTLGIVCVLILSLLAPSFIGAQAHWEGNTIVAKRSSKGKMELTQTPYSYKTTKGDIYPIYINKETGRCYTKRVSKTTGIERNQPLSESDSKDICKKLGIPYTYKSKKNENNNKGKMPSL